MSANLDLVRSTCAGEMRSNVAALFQMHVGKVTRLSLWRDRDRALADLGLEG